MMQGYAIIWNGMRYFEISGHLSGTCHINYTLAKDTKKPPNIAPKTLIEASP